MTLYLGFCFIFRYNFWILLIKLGSVYFLHFGHLSYYLGRLEGRDG